MSDTTAAHVAETDTAAAVIAGIEIAGPQQLDGSDRFFTQLIPAGAKVETIDLEALEEKLALNPRRKKGTVHVQDAASFITYIEKHGLPCTEVYADPARLTLVGVINAHEESTTDEAAENKAGHGDHRVALELLQTPAWKAWLALDKKFVSQVEFAEHLEDNAANVIDPDAATMLEIAQSLVASTTVDFKSAERIDSGTVSFRFEETQTARAGQTGDIEIPTTFRLALAPFEGADLVEVVARFRYRVGNPLRLSYALLDPVEIARKAFLDHVEAVRDAITPPVFQGRPE